MKDKFAIVVLSLASTLAAASSAADFYQWDAAIPAKAGQLLRSENLEADLVLNAAASGQRILYSSLGVDGDPVVVSGAIFTPQGDAPEGGWPVMAWSHGTVGIADHCAPSRAGRSERDVSFLNQWLEAGYAIVATDYEGLGTAGVHPYLHCRSEAYSNIDAVRAAQASGQPLSPQWMVMGQSQGGQGAMCTGAYVAEYAPEQAFLGTLATAPGGANMMDRFNAGDGNEPNPFIGISLMMLRGFEVYSEGFSAADALTPEALAMMPLTEKHCVFELMGIGAKAGMTTGDTFKYIPFGATPGIADAAEKMEVPRTGWTQPLYIAQGTADPMVRYVDTLKYSQALCEQGMAVTLDVYEGADHSGPMNQGFARFAAWAGERFEDKKDSGACALINELAREN